MAIQSSELDDLAVEFETVVSEFGVTEADAAVILIDKLRTPQKADVDGVEIVIIEIPKLDAAQTVEVAGVDDGVGGSLSLGML